MPLLFFNSSDSLFMRRWLQVCRRQGLCQASAVLSVMWFGLTNMLTGQGLAQPNKEQTIQSQPLPPPP